jgi:hypothetical protein
LVNNHIKVALALALGIGLAGCGATGVPERIAGQIDGRNISALGQLRDVNCSRSAHGWDCTATASGHEVYCALDAIGSRVGPFFCIRARLPRGTRHPVKTAAYDWDFAVKRRGHVELYAISGANEPIIYARARAKAGRTAITLYVYDVAYIETSANPRCVTLTLPPALRQRPIVHGSPRETNPPGTVSLHPWLVRYSRAVAAGTRPCATIPTL